MAEHSTTEPEEEPPVTTAGEGRHELRSPSKHRTNVVFAILAAVLLGVLGVAIATQVRSTVAGDSLDAARPADLLVVLDNLNRREAALRQEVRIFRNRLPLWKPVATREQRWTRRGRG